jgi:ParB family chromosome partitioning protein
VEEQAPGKKERRKKHRKADPQLAAIEERAEMRFGTRVKITPRRKGGVISIDYYSNEELEAILEKMGVDTEM